MPIVKVIEVIASSEKSFDDAVKHRIAEMAALRLKSVSLVGSQLSGDGAGTASICSQVKEHESVLQLCAARVVRHPNCAAARSASSRAIGMAEVAAGEGALQTWIVRSVSRMRKSWTSVPSAKTA